MVDSRDKGARLEREAAKALQELGFPFARRAARNGVDGAADIVGTPGVRVEVKGRAKIGALRFLDQARAEAIGDETPVVLMRENNGRWVLMVELERFGDLRESLRQARGL